MIIQTPKGSRRCRRCGGSGQFSHGQCFNCLGAGFTTPQPKATPRHTISPSRRAATITAIRTRATELDGFRNGPTETETSWARSLLEDNEPSRFERLVISVEAGRIDDVISALIGYYRQHATEE